MMAVVSTPKASATSRSIPFATVPRPLGPSRMTLPLAMYVRTLP